MPRARRIPRLLPALLPALLGLALAQAPAAAEGTGSGEAELLACVERNAPHADTFRSARITARDRMGNKTVTVAEMYGRHGADGRRKLLVRFLEPLDLRGSSLLVLERGTGVEIHLVSPALEKVVRVETGGRSSSIFGTDFSYADLEYLEGFLEPGAWTWVGDETRSARPVHKVEAKPADSVYDRIVSYVDAESCLPLHAQLYEGRLLRKEFTLAPSSIRRVGDVWIAHEITLRDLRDLTSTHLWVGTSSARRVPDELFTVEGLRADYIEEPSGEPSP